MITLSRHIEILLLEHDCVIIPGLGGFIANQASSRISDSGDNLLLPPYRTVGFNKELSLNDGLLVQSYMQAYDAAYPEAYLQMEKDIDEMMAQLNTNGSYTFNGVGTLSKNIENGITFSAMESGILTPQLYGLYSIEMKSLEECRKEKEIQKALSQTSVLPIQTETDLNNNQPKEKQEETPKADKKDSKKSNKEVVIRLPKRWAEVAVAASVAVIMFFLFSYPSLKSEEELSDTCVASTVYVGTPSSLASIPEKRTTSATTESKIVTNNTSAKVESQKPSSNANQSKTPSAEGKNWVIVLASCVGERNANQFINNIAAEGFKEARYVKGDKNRIVYSAYATQTEAANALVELRKQSTTFKDAWVLYMNK